MAKTVGAIVDHEVREFCVFMEAQYAAWHEAVRVIQEHPQKLAIAQMEFPCLQDEPDFAAYLSSSLAAARRLADKLSTLRAVDARIRVEGFDARRAGKPITLNPYVEILIDRDDPLDSVHSLKSRAAIPWHIGWKQAGRAGEDHFP